MRGRGTLKRHPSGVDIYRMAVHVICPSLRCRKILTLADDVRGTLVSCRYCQMEFRVPAPRRTDLISTSPAAYTASPRVRLAK